MFFSFKNKNALYLGKDQRQDAFNSLDQLETELIFLEDIAYIIENFSEEHVPYYLYERLAVHIRHVRTFFNEAHNIIFK